ncbi:unnamed protein product [Phyllotreta striolata]|uniref:PPM-type phosphatase domain-containing protein n=1 Tax=Phyllotreta striolata TaxID=444603 RepID=A0A9N9XRZ5_PHYSR|nr:unnamed protein product [Phyllotreta striolata]
MALTICRYYKFMKPFSTNKTSACPLNQTNPLGNSLNTVNSIPIQLGNSLRRYLSMDHFESNDNRPAVSKLSPQEVDVILRANQYTHEFHEGSSVKSYDSNQLASNKPIEDTRAEASCLLTTGFMFGVFDGHGGSACAQVISKRLFDYVAARLLPYDSLLGYKNTYKKEPRRLIDSYNDNVQFVDDVRKLYGDSFDRFLNDLANEGAVKNFEMPDAMEKAFLRLDKDIGDEALPKVEKERVNLKTMSVAMSGAVVCLAHVDGPHLHVANVGDCSAVLGSLSETDTWLANKLNTEHNAYHRAEADRVLSEHPASERRSLLRADRLLGQLAPLRALGDYRFKWPLKVMRDVVVAAFGEGVVPPEYRTPPYLTARPEVVYRKLTARDKFLIIGTDGLWDVVTPLQAVRLVGEHMAGKVTLEPLILPRRNNITLSEIETMLKRRREGRRTKPRDANAATHVIRHALGAGEFGLDHVKLAKLLSLPDDVVRVFRDDITVTIVYFDSEYLRHCPA